MTLQNEFELGILDQLEARGGRCTRPQLIEALIVNSVQKELAYRAAEQALVDAKQIEVRRGRKGGIFRVTEVELEPTPEAIGAALTEERRKEKDHYDDLQAVLGASWAKDERFLSVHVCQTAYLGRRNTGGRWTRPDLTALCVSRRLFDSAKRGDVRTFEVKLYDALDVSAVFEAVSHRARSHYAYLLIVDAPANAGDDERLEPVIAEAARHGIGVYVIARGCSRDYDTGWELHLDARLSDADPIAIESFVEQCVAELVRSEFRTALNT